MSRRLFYVGLWLAILSLMLSSRALAQGTDSAKITSPKAGESLFGNVTIQGTAANPNMQRYVLQFDSQDDDSETWLPIAGPITQQVNNGVLGLWDTTNIPDGRYRIRLRVVLRDGTVLDNVVEGLRISNKQPTPLPTPLPAATDIPPTQPPTAGPSVTPLIQQPPTNTVRPPTATVIPAGPVQAVNQGPDSAQVVGAFDALGNAFCNGAYIAIAAFVIVGLYSLVHVRVRPVIRRFMRQLRG